MEQEQHRKYHLSTEGYYFKYRPDKYNQEALRADLFDTKDNQLESITVKNSDYGINMSHTDVINRFEVMVSTTDI